jgi:hypothetical protein
MRRQIHVVAPKENVFNGFPLNSHEMYVMVAIGTERTRLRSSDPGPAHSESLVRVAVAGRRVLPEPAGHGRPASHLRKGAPPRTIRV